jgi:uncharacterized low-complexity protein
MQQMLLVSEELIWFSDLLPRLDVHPKCVGHHWLYFVSRHTPHGHQQDLLCLATIDKGCALRLFKCIMTATEVVAETPEVEQVAAEDAAADGATGLSKSAKKRAKQKAKKATENETGADAADSAEAPAGQEQQAADNDAESGDEDDDGDEADAAGECY